MTKLSEYVEIASQEYLQETGKADLDAHWIAEFFQDSGILDEYPRQDLVGFAGMVQKSLTLRYEAQHRPYSAENILHFINRQRRP